jgi:membrane associated rhomboid family serine protease
MGAFIITFPRDRIRTLLFFLIFIRISYIPAVFLIGFWFLIQVLNFGSIASVRTGGVAHLAHIGGFLFGIATARIFADPRRIGFRGPTYR